MFYVRQDLLDMHIVLFNYLHNYDKLCIVNCVCLVKFEYLHIGVSK